MSDIDPKLKDVKVVAGSIVISRQMLRDMLPKIPTQMMCAHCNGFTSNRPPPTKGARYHCDVCDKDWVAKKRRPPRGGGYNCYECGQHVPKDPKQPKRWIWMIEKAA